jgi:hypothetical protein
MERRRNLKEQHRLRRGRNVAVIYPDGLKPLPKFSVWLSTAISDSTESDDKPSANQVEASKLPEQQATAYRAMYARGMHLRVRSAEEEKVTCDSEIASSIFRAARGRGNENPGYFEAAEYIGWIEEILELEYRSHCCVVLVCSWVRAYPEREGASIIHDKYGFTLGNFEKTLPLGADSFAFPK